MASQQKPSVPAGDTSDEGRPWGAAYNAFVNEFKGESDRAAVILGAAKLDAVLGHLLERFLLPSATGTDELLDGDSPLSTFSAKINMCYRLGLISNDFAKSLHLVRRIRNSFAHEALGVSLETGAHADRLKSLLMPMQSLPRFRKFRDTIIGKSSASNDFRACLSLMVGRLEGILENVSPIQPQPKNVLLLPALFDPLSDENKPEAGDEKRADV